MNHIEEILEDLYWCRRVRTDESMVTKSDFVPALEEEGVVYAVSEILDKVRAEAKQMELCEILTHVLGYSNWHSPYRPVPEFAPLRPNKTYTPFEAFRALNKNAQRIVISLFGRVPQKEDGLKDLSAPVNYES